MLCPFCKEKDTSVNIEDITIIESLTCFNRAGCDGILTYFAPEAADILDTSSGFWKCG